MRPWEGFHQRSSTRPASSELEVVKWDEEQRNLPVSLVRLPEDALHIVVVGVRLRLEHQSRPQISLVDPGQRVP